jgi:hypothetical protein
MIWLTKTEPKAKAKSDDQKGKTKEEERCDPQHSEPVSSQPQSGQQDQKPQKSSKWK